MSSRPESRAILLGIAGGTGSGKTSITEALMKELGREEVVALEQDAYYHDLSHLQPAERARINFDHPDSVDFKRMRQDLKALLKGKSVDVPIYDYTAHSRKPETRHISGHRVIILEGILVLTDPDVRELMDIKIYVETAADVRFIRRMMRDVKTRNRSFESVVDQYYKTVRPMHAQFVEPTKRYADIIIPEGGQNRVAIDILTTKILALLGEGMPTGKVIAP
ncbi:MAG: uridine kinase [Candidatus Marinimicrobia bacterium]|nr:uridine kinase [Candidatus Neomarinimicrobiota bacterium]